MSEMYLMLNDEQVTYVGLDPSKTWRAVLGLGEAGLHHTFVTCDEVAFESDFNATESGVFPPDEFGQWLQAVLFEVEG